MVKWTIRVPNHPELMTSAQDAVWHPTSSETIAPARVFDEAIVHSTPPQVIDLKPDCDIVDHVF
jgi:hypothetical protein